METDDNPTSVPVPQSHPNSARHTSQDLSPSASSLQLPRFRIHDKLEAAVKLERNLQPRVELLEEDESFVSSLMQSFREQVQEHVNDQVPEELWHTLFF